jgi:hypothetical protein
MNKTKKSYQNAKNKIKSKTENIHHHYNHNIESISKKDRDE